MSYNYSRALLRRQGLNHLLTPWTTVGRGDDSELSKQGDERTVSCLSPRVNSQGWDAILAQGLDET